MKVLFLTIANINSLNEKGIYADLLKEFTNGGHQVYVVNPIERRYKKSSYLVSEDGAEILHVKTFNLQKTNIIEKGIGTLAIEHQYLAAIKKYFFNQKFDLILYSTPPITFSKVIRFFKQRDNTFSYLLLKDIFPQNAIDMKMLKSNSFLHKFFLKKEKELYSLSDKIGCMSPANKKYLIKYNPNVKSNKVEVNPNSIKPVYKDFDTFEQSAIRKKYQLPLNKKVFVYGGNLGIPQGIDFLLETIDKTTNPAVFFLIVGSGTEFERIQEWFDLKNPQNALLLNNLPRTEYENLLKACDVGLLFLHENFTIPNFPCRLLSYLEIKLPILAATDINTDVGEIIEQAQCGYWVKAGDIQSMISKIDKLCIEELIYQKMKKNAWNLLVNEYNSKLSYDLIINAISQNTQIKY